MSCVYEFGPFTFDANQKALWRDGRSVRLSPQPADVLAALLRGAGQVVTRDELRRAVWPEDTYVDFERGLNFCIAQVRAALGDRAGTPIYIRTLPKRGYEFIYPLAAPSAQRAEVSTILADPHKARSRGVFLAAAVVMTIVAAASAAFIVWRDDTAIVAVARFDNETANPAYTRFADELTDSVVAQLTEDGRGRYRVVGNAAILRVPRDHRDLTAVAASLHARYVVLGQVQGKEDDTVRVLAHLIRLPDQTHVAVSRTEQAGESPASATDQVAEHIALVFHDHLR